MIFFATNSVQLLHEFELVWYALLKCVNYVMSQRIHKINEVQHANLEHFI